MISIKINNKKEFMSKLLISEMFDSFLVEEANIDTFNSFHIDGKIHKDYYKNDADYSDESFTSKLSSWGSLKQICYDLIKGKRTPLSFKFVFHADDALKAQVAGNDVNGLSLNDITLGLNIRFSGGEAIITTGSAFSVFTLDKTIEKAWDAFIPSFLEKSGISTEIL